MNRQERLDKLINQLKGVIKEEEIPKWLDTPNPAFGGKKPKNVPIADLRRMIYYIQSGVPM